METQFKVPDTLENLQALEREVEPEWWWPHGALNAVIHGVMEERMNWTQRVLIVLCGFSLAFARARRVGQPLQELAH